MKAHTTFSVAIIGPDGAGKTTVCRRVIDALPLPARYVYMGINPDASTHTLPTTRLLHRLKRALRGSPSQVGSPRPRREDRPPRSRVRRIARATKRTLTLTNSLADDWYRQARVWIYERRGNIVLFDRHVLFDYYSWNATEPGTWRPLSRRIHGWVLTHLYPRPDLVVFLDAPGDVLYARKGEGTPESLEERREEYRRLEELVEHFVVIDATLPEDEVVTRALRLIEEFAVERTMD
jgi:thymidylate kinase